MPKVVADGKANSKSESQPQAYPPSWIDRFIAWVERKPGPSWSYYLGIGLALLVVQTAVLWGEGAFPIGTFLPIHVFFAVMIPSFLAQVHYLDNAADKALTTLRPALKASEEEYSELRYQLMMSPARPTLLVGLAIVAASILADFRGTPPSFQAVAASPVSATLLYFIYKCSWWLFATLIYHTVHQLGQIDRICTQHTRINLFRMRPLYAFSRVTALTAVSLTVPPYAFLVVNPGNLLHDPIALGIYLAVTALALAAFAWPLLGVHRLLVEEKGLLLDEICLRFEAAIVELHQRMDSGDLEGVDALNKVMTTLELELNALDRIPTWPWHPETVRLLITALVLPLGLWITQFVLQLILGQ